MDTAVQIVNAYLQLNGYFTIGEFPIVEASRKGAFATATDIDILALRFPHPEHRIPIRSGGESACSHASIHLQVDSELDLPTDCMDMIIGEVKQSTAKLNPRLLDMLEHLSRYGEPLKPAQFGDPTGAVPSVEQARLLERAEGRRPRLIGLGSCLRHWPRKPA